MSEELKEVEPKSSPMKWIVLGVVIGIIVIASSIFAYSFFNRPKPEITLVNGYESFQGLNYVYIGNMPGHSAENTYCPTCGRLLIDRIGYTIKKIDLDKGRCRYCKEKIPGQWGI